MRVSFQRKVAVVEGVPGRNLAPAPKATLLDVCGKLHEFLSEKLCRPWRYWLGLRLRIAPAEAPILRESTQRAIIISEITRAQGLDTSSMIPIERRHCAWTTCGDGSRCRAEP